MQCPCLPAAEHGGQRVGALLVIQAQCVCRNDLFADGMDAFVLLENVRVNGAGHLGDEIARDKSPGMAAPVYISTFARISLMVRLFVTLNDHMPSTFHA